MLADWIVEEAEPVVTDLYRELIKSRPAKLWEFINQLSESRVSESRLSDGKGDGVSLWLQPPCSDCLSQCQLTHELRRAYMATVYDTLQLAEIQRRQPHELSQAVLAAKRRAMQRSRHVLSLGLPLSQIVQRAAPSQDSSTEEDDDFCDQLPDILEMAPLTWRSHARPSVRAEVATGSTILGHWEKTEEESHLIRDRLSCLFLFEALEDEDSLRKLVNCLKPVEFGSGVEIFGIGDPGDGIYLIKNGTVILKRNSKILKELKRGDVFGELGVLHALDPRSHSAIATSQCSLWFLDRGSYSTLIREGRKQ